MPTDQAIAVSQVVSVAGLPTSSACRASDKYTYPGLSVKTLDTQPGWPLVNTWTLYITPDMYIHTRDTNGSICVVSGTRAPMRATMNARPRQNSACSPIAGASSNQRHVSGTPLISRIGTMTNSE